jgi:predicted transcriptional regulator
LARYRSKFEIIADILKIAKQDVRKTHIIYRGNLSFKLATTYLRTVSRAGLIAFDHESQRYKTTKKGKDYLAVFDEYCRHVKNLEERSLRIKNELSHLNQLYLTLANPIEDSAGKDSLNRNNRVKRIKSDTPSSK